MSKPDRSCVIRLAQAQARIPGPAGEHSVSVLQRGTLDVKLSLPTPPNQQTPHAQDEVYVVIRGRDESGDLLFVAAGTEHRFEDFSEDFAVWVVFYGSRGGEVPATKSSVRTSSTSGGQDDDPTAALGGWIDAAGTSHNEQASE